MYLDFAERQVKLGHIISMQEWKDKLETFLNLNEYNEILILSISLLTVERKLNLIKANYILIIFC